MMEKQCEDLVRLAKSIVDNARAIYEYRRVGIIPGWLQRKRDMLPADCVAVLNRWDAGDYDNQVADAALVADAEHVIFDKWLARQTKALRADLAAYTGMLEPVRLHLVGSVTGAGPFTVSSHARAVQEFGETILSTMVDRYRAWGPAAKAVEGVDPDALLAGVEVEVGRLLCEPEPVAAQEPAKLGAMERDISETRDLVRGLVQRAADAEAREQAQQVADATATQGAKAESKAEPCAPDYTETHEAVLTLLVEALPGTLKSGDIKVPGLTVTKTRWRVLRDLRELGLADLPGGKKRWLATPLGVERIGR